MTPGLDRESIQADEERVFKKMVELTRSQATTHEGRPLRVQHAKATGCVAAEFTTSNNISSDLRHGVFAAPDRTFQAIVRFSNSQGTIEPDGEGTVRGIAIKLKGVEGPRAVSDDRDATQDFLLVNHPVFLFPHPQAYLDIMSRKSVPLIGGLFAAVHLLVFERDELAILNEMKGKQVASPLEITYWSGSPYWLGAADGSVGNAVKYSLVPRDVFSPLPEHPEKLPEDYLTRAMAKHLGGRDAIFDFRVQLQGDPKAMPVEDLTVKWDEAVSRPITVATLTIKPQEVDLRSEVSEECEATSFTPWHALINHRPLGGMNRLRLAVYKASAEHRAGQ